MGSHQWQSFEITSSRLYPFLLGLSWISTNVVRSMSEQERDKRRLSNNDMASMIIISRQVKEHKMEQVKQTKLTI
jgi:hypothetical protein